VTSIPKHSTTRCVHTAARSSALSEDLQITLGEAAANAAEHAYASASELGEFTYRLTRRGDGAIEVEMRDFGRWRPEPPATTTADAASP
jgi:anti-sigma regulatory factor (Ser/Thr protein kinase)